MPKNTSISCFGAMIVNWLVAKNGFEQGASVDYNREYAIDETRKKAYIFPCP